MQLQKPNIHNDTEYYKSYLNKNILELQNIQPCWAFGVNTDKIFNYILRPINNRYTIFLVHTKDIVENSEFGEVSFDNLFTGNNNNDVRIARILYRWDRELFIDPPSIYINAPTSKKVSFDDGRHRTKVCHFLGINQMPVAIDNSDIDRIRDILRLIKI